MMSAIPRPPELELEGCVIRTSYGTGGRVLEVRPHLPGSGWYIIFVDKTGYTCWLDEVFVEDGQIYAYPWRDRVEVVERGPRQLRLF